jgi:uncharacterized tellurite resistance protein B-like protein
MADWKKLLTKVLLADGTVDAAEVKILKKEILADGEVDSEEIDFLVGLRNAAKQNSPEFDKFFFAALQKNLLADGVIDAAEAKKLRTILYADKVIDANEKKFLASLKKGAKETSPEFNKLYEECMK